jgi:hypothetical protein
MKFTGRFLSLLVVSMALSCLLAAQTPATQPSPVVPQLVNYSGVATNAQGEAISGIAGVTFAIYKAQYDGAPLWLESQNTQADSKGNFTIQLGAATSGGVPLQLFASGEARWLGVRINGGEEQPRVLLVSVPYALKAADAQTLGGLPPSAFMLAPESSSGATPFSPSPNSATGSVGTASPPVGGTGSEGYVAYWTDNTGDLGNSVLYQSGTGSSAKIGINEKNPLFTLDVNGQELVRGLLEMATTNYATPTKAYNSQPFNLESSAYNSGTAAYTLNHFQWQAEPTGNNTPSPGATLNLLYGTDPAMPAETGLQLSNKGVFTFAPGQTFPGTGTITGVTTATGSGLTGGGTSGTLTLSLTNSCSTNQVLQWNGTTWVCTTIAGGGTITGVTAGTDLTGGGTSGSVTLNLDTTKVPQLNAANNFKGDQSVVGNVSVGKGYGFNIGGVPFAFGSLANGNALLGFAGNSTMTGIDNTASGVQSLLSNTSGSRNVAAGYQALYSNTGSGKEAGSDSTAIGYQALFANTTGSEGTAIGSGALYSNTTGYEDTATGFQALNANTTGSFNTATGYGTLGANTTASFNTGDGYGALISNTTGSGNTATGAQALLNNTTGVANVAVGFSALAYSTTASNNTAIGENALFSNTTGNQNTADGNDALYTNTTGANNTANGLDALFSNSTASRNTATGSYALYANDVGGDNTAVGFQALYTNSSGYGSSNTAVGSQALYGNTNGGGNTATGAGAMYINSIGFFDTATGYQSLYSNIGGVEDTADGYQAIYYNQSGSYNTAMGYQAFYRSVDGNYNTAVGIYALCLGEIGNENTALGGYALFNTSGDLNTAVGLNALYDDTLGAQNTAVGSGALASNYTGDDLTCVGYGCDSDVDGLSNATAIGAHAIVGQSNSLILGGTGQYAVNVGIGTTKPSNILTIGRGSGHPVSDSWETYSSRRWKTNIQTLPDALAKVEQLRGVSYDRKDNGKREIGVIAEEVGAVVPEIVSWEANGKDASGVDYSRLTAVLIEAVKQQQAEIAKQEQKLAKQSSEMAKQESKLAKQSLEIARAMQQIKSQQTSARTQAASIRALETKLTSYARQVEDGGLSNQTVLGASK